MSLQSFDAYRLALQFHREVRALRLPFYLRDQLLRASSSVALNLAEGYGKPTPADKRRFYGIALGSVRECQAALDLAEASALSAPRSTGDRLAACVYRLVHPAKRA